MLDGEYPEGRGNDSGLQLLIGEPQPPDSGL